MALSTLKDHWKSDLKLQTFPLICGYLRRSASKYKMQIPNDIYLLCHEFVGIGIGIDTKILNSIEKEMLCSLLSQYFDKNKNISNLSNTTLSFNLLYRQSIDGATAKKFHQKCDYKPNTITIVETMKNYVFGGFTRIAWNSMAYADNNAFLFLLRTPEQNNSFKSSELNDKCGIFQIRKEYTGYAVCPSPSTGPAFGVEGRSLKVLDYSRHGTFGNPIYYDIDDERYKEFIENNYNFVIKECEVFSLYQYK